MGLFTPHSDDTILPDFPVTKGPIQDDLNPAAAAKGMANKLLTVGLIRAGRDGKGIAEAFKNSGFAYTLSSDNHVEVLVP